MVVNILNVAVRHSPGRCRGRQDGSAVRTDGMVGLPPNPFVSGGTRRRWGGGGWTVLQMQQILYNISFNGTRTTSRKRFRGDFPC